VHRLLNEEAQQSVPEYAAPLLVEGETCWRRAVADRGAVLVDGADYFSAVRSSFLKAERSISIVGWDVDSRTRLRGAGPPDDGAPEALGELLCYLVKRRPRLSVRVLLWDYSVLYALEREPFPKLALDWRTPRQVQVLLDDRLPLGASHHEKLVIVDDGVAYCGGLDLTMRRWDTSEHLPRRADRRDPDGAPYGPFHDAQMLLDGAAAAGLAEHVRERWLRAGSSESFELQPSSRAWPDGVKPQFENVTIGIARTSGALEEQAEIRESEALCIKALSRAERLVYIENQYLTAASVADALVARMKQKPSLEALIVTPQSPSGWLETQTMGLGRCRFMEKFDVPMIRSRVGFGYPVSGDVPIYVHAKVMVVDDYFLKIGSANLNQRSMGLDTECDIGIEATNADERSRIAAVRNRLLGEHFGVRHIEQTAAAAGSWVSLLDEARPPGRRLQRLEVEPPPVDAPPVVAELGDPERAVDPSEFIGDMFGAREYRAAFRRAARVLIVVGLILGLIALWHALGLSEYVTPERISGLLERLRQSPWVVPVVLCAFLIGSLIVFPVTALIGSAAVVLGPEEGFLWSSIGALLGAGLTYRVGALLGRRPLRTLLGSNLSRIDRQLHRRGVFSVVVLRTVPVAPFTIINLAMGASSIRFLDYMLGTVLGMFPGIAAIALLGDRLAAVWNQPRPANLGLVALAVGFWLSVVFGTQWLVNRLDRE
jgi:phospholipase D1/2